MNLKIVCGALLTLVFVLPGAVFAHTGKIIKMEFGPTYGSIVHIDLEGSSPAACANNPNGYDYSFDAATDSGKLTYSALLAAQRSAVAVTIRGTGSCTLNTWGGNTEDMRFMVTR